MTKINIDKKLQPLRKQISSIDNELIKLLSERLEVVKEVWKIKKEYNIQPLQEKRWLEVLDNISSEAEELWLDKDFIIDIWNTIHKEALRLEK